jgi:type I restriction enzyme, S subunit
MENWKTYTISQTGTVITGKTPSSNTPKHFGNIMPFVTPTDFKNYIKSIFTADRYISELGINSNKTRIIPPNSVLVTCIGSDMGKVAINKVACLTNQQINSIILDKTLADKDFVYYALTSKYEFLSTLARGGSTMPIINKSQFERISIFLPPITEQRRIAEILSSLDDKIELNRQMNATLEAMAKALFKAWFVDFEPVRANLEGRPSASASVEIAKLFPAEFDGDLPKGWRIVMFWDLFSFVVDNRGKTPPLSLQGIKLLESFQISCENPFPDFSNTSKQKFVSEGIYNSLKWFRTKHPQHLDILCATVGAGLPKWCFTPSKISFGLAQNAVAFRTNDKITSPFFAKCLMDTDDFLWNFNSRIVTTAQPSIKVGPLKAIPIILPPRDLIRCFDKVTIPIYTKLEQIYYQNQMLTELRDSLLPRLISGKIRVDEAEKML